MHPAGATEPSGGNGGDPNRNWGEHWDDSDSPATRTPITITKATA
jgi:hypothetical protein